MRKDMGKGSLRQIQISSKPYDLMLYQCLQYQEIVPKMT